MSAGSVSLKAAAVTVAGSAGREKVTFTSWPAGTSSAPGTGSREEMARFWPVVKVQPSLVAGVPSVARSPEVSVTR